MYLLSFGFLPHVTAVVCGRDVRNGAALVELLPISQITYCDQSVTLRCTLMGNICFIFSFPLSFLYLFLHKMSLKINDLDLSQTLRILLS